MKNNVGEWDRNTRWIVGTGAILLSLAAPLPKGWKVGLLAFGATELLTGTSRYCPVNELIGVNTNYTGPREMARSLAHAVS